MIWKIKINATNKCVRRKIRNKKIEMEMKKEDTV